MKNVTPMAISSDRPGHRATDVSDLGPNEFFIKSGKKSKYISLHKNKSQIK